VKKLVILSTTLLALALVLGGIGCGGNEGGRPTVTPQGTSTPTQPVGQTSQVVETTNVRTTLADIRWQTGMLVMSLTIDNIGGSSQSVDDIYCADSQGQIYRLQMSTLNNPTIVPGQVVSGDISPYLVWPISVVGTRSDFKLIVMCSGMKVAQFDLPRLNTLPGWINGNVNFSDVRLEQAIRSYLQLGIGDLSKMDCTYPGIVDLNLEGKGITDISGIENFTGIGELKLGNNLIEDISPLKNLNKLYELEIQNNNINDISVLLNLSNLKMVYLGGNKLDLTEGSTAMNVIRTLQSRGVNVQY
jgi:Leucine-rich repeat (LRR) protein